MLSGIPTLYVDREYASPYALSVFVALMEKQLPFQLHTLNLAANEQCGFEFSRCSLTRRVPTLAWADFSLSESSAITELLDEQWPSPALYPQSLEQKAKARQIQAWLRSDLLPLRIERSTEVIYFAPNPAPLSAAAQQAADKLLAIACELLQPGQAHIFSAWSIVDIDLSLMLNRLHRNGDPLPAHLIDYIERQWSRPAVQAWLNLDRPQPLGE
ncbi:glutathione transferase [Chitinibacter tainanensis]|uniref:glutathione transferase n=1 Tax=Chitinibacter tainanensis TaxID=230667 RepID=UPI0004208F67|nr:glutathione transferase [Chitinibacter tainanensis]